MKRSKEMEDYLDKGFMWLLIILFSTPVIGIVFFIIFGSGIC